MQYVQKNSVPVKALPGRGLQKVIGKDSYFESEIMSVGYALYNEDFGDMDPHQHAEETVIITDTKNGYISWGDEKGKLDETIKLEKGMIFHIPENKWHVFTYDTDGHVEIIFIYGSTDNLR